MDLAGIARDKIWCAWSASVSCLRPCLSCLCFCSRLSNSAPVIGLEMSAADITALLPQRVPFFFRRPSSPTFLLPYCILSCCGPQFFVLKVSLKTERCQHNVGTSAKLGASSSPFACGAAPRFALLTCRIFAGHVRNAGWLSYCSSSAPSSSAASEKRGLCGAGDLVAQQRSSRRPASLRVSDLARRRRRQRQKQQHLRLRRVR